MSPTSETSSGGNLDVKLTLTADGEYQVASAPSDAATVKFVIPIVSVAADQNNPGSVDFTRSDSSGTLVVNYNVNGGWTTWGPSEETVTFDPGVSEVTVNAIQGTYSYAGAIVALCNSSGNGYVVNSSQNVVVATNPADQRADPLSESISATNSTVLEDSTGGVQFTVTITTDDSDYGGPDVCGVFLVGGSAVLGQDYTLTVSGEQPGVYPSGEYDGGQEICVVFPTREADTTLTATLDLVPVVNSLNPGNKTVVLQPFGADYSSGGDWNCGNQGFAFDGDPATVTIKDDTALPTVTIGDGVAVEGDQEKFTVTLSPPPNGAAGVVVHGGLHDRWRNGRGGDRLRRQ